MKLGDYNRLWLSESRTLICLERSEILSEVVIDNYQFKVSWSPVHRDYCVLWFRDTQVSAAFEVLGKFSHFERKNVLNFVTRYSTSELLREEIERRKFERRIENLPASFFRRVDALSGAAREHANRNLYSLDYIIERKDLARKRKIMAKKFHPDTGGDGRAMTVINEAYEYLLSRASA